MTGLATSTRIAAGLAALLLAGCGPDSSSARASGPPTAPGDCHDLGTHRGDGFVLAGSDWSGETRGYHDAAMIYACTSASGEGTVRFRVTGDGITVSPSHRALSAYPGGVVPFTVHVSPGASGSLVMLQQGPGGSSGGPGPTVVTEADGWRFEPSE
jgi:hypothetical protein